MGAGRHVIDATGTRLTIRAPACGPTLPHGFEVLAWRSLKAIRAPQI